MLKDFRLIYNFVFDDGIESRKGKQAVELHPHAAAPQRRSSVLPQRCNAEKPEQSKVATPQRQKTETFQSSNAETLQQPGGNVGLINVAVDTMSF